MNYNRTNKMKAVIAVSPGGVDVLQITNIPIPSPGDNDVLIKVFAAGVNRADIEQRKGMYPPPSGTSPILGLEVSGFIEAIGNKVTQFEVGEKVMSLLSSGGYAEYVVVDSRMCIPIPKILDPIQAAAIPEASFTVWSMLFDAARLSENETLLIHGGSGGVGSFAIQLAHQLNIKVITTSGTDEKCKACYLLGADKAINYKTHDFFAEVQNYTNNVGIDVILDVVGSDYISRNLKLLKRGGRIAYIDSQGDSLAVIDLISILTRNLTITGGVLRPRPLLEKIALRDQILDNVMPLVCSGKIIPVIAKVFPIENVRMAHEFLEIGAHIGKVVLSFDN